MFKRFILLIVSMIFAMSSVESFGAWGSAIEKAGKAVPGVKVVQEQIDAGAQAILVRIQKAFGVYAERGAIPNKWPSHGSNAARPAG